MYRSGARTAIIALMFCFTLLGPQVVAAQQTADSASGLTVTGYGEASAPAETATLQLAITSDNFAPPQSPPPGSVPGAQERESVEPIVSSLTALGIPEEDIEVIVGPYIANVASYMGPAIAMIRVTVTNPSAETITDVVDAASAGAAERRLFVGGVDATFDVTDCAALEVQARESAIADARQRADTQAELLDVTYGDLIAARAVPYGPESAVAIFGPVHAGSACVPVDTDAFLLGGFGPLTFDPAQEPVVTVHAQVELTFAMSSAGDATPAS